MYVALAQLFPNTEVFVSTTSTVSWHLNDHKTEKQNLELLLEHKTVNMTIVFYRIVYSFFLRSIKRNPRRLDLKNSAA